MKQPIAFCALLATGLLGAAVHAQQHSADEQGFAEALHLGANVKLNYLDSNGKSISFAEFTKQMGQGISFKINKQPEANLAVLQLNKAGDKPPSLSLKLKVKPGEALPAFSLDSTHGRRITNADLAGRYTLLSFYFADCLPCIAEVPALNAFASPHKDINVLAVTYEDRDTATRFAAQRGLQWNSIIDAQNWIDTLGLSSYPTLLLVDPRGHLAAATISTTLARKDTPSAEDIARWVHQHRTSVIDAAAPTN